MQAEWIILADSAEVINNKLYLLGGGWDTLTVNTGFPTQHQFAIAVAFRIPWNETNQQHDVEVEIADQDGKSLAKIDGQIEIGGPPGIPLGHAQLVQMAVRLGLVVEKPGAHVVIARVEGQLSKKVVFNVIPGVLFTSPRVGQSAPDESTSRRRELPAAPSLREP